MRMMASKRYSYKSVFLLLIACVLAFIIWKLPQLRHMRTIPIFGGYYYEKALNEFASPDKTIILCMVDESFADMAINFHQTSLVPHSISNFLFLGASTKTCEILSRHSIPCYRYAEDEKSGIPSSFNSKDFKRKMNIRADMIYDALSFGFTVVHTDVDVHFFKNPLPLLKEILERTDLAALWDVTNYNAGFLGIKPTSYTKQVYQIVKNLSHLRNDQMNLNAAMNRISKENPGVFKPEKLDAKKFPCGLYYFEVGRRYFPGPCDDCVVMHNNWIVSKEAKVYRFKEHRMWMNDEHGYYSSPLSAYLTYSNPSSLDVVNSSTLRSKIRDRQLKALQTALILARMLDRKLILPRFKCFGKNAEIYECPLNSLIHIARFDKVFKGEYRESTFLSHPLVPKNVKKSQSREIILVATESGKVLEKEAEDLPQNIESSSDVVKEPIRQILFDLYIKEVLSPFQEKVLVFRAFFGIDLSFSDRDPQVKFLSDVSLGIKHSNYRQL